MPVSQLLRCLLLAGLLAPGLLPEQPGVRAQVFNGRNVQWELSRPEEPRLKLRFGTAGASFGYEGTSVVVENLTDGKLYVELELRLQDYCNQEMVHQVQVTVRPHAKVGGDTWMGGSEQLDYGTSCKTLHDYSPTFRSRIARVALAIVTVKELPTPGRNGNNTPVAGGSSPATPGTSTSGSDSGGSGNGASECPTFNFQLNGPVDYHCAPLLWMVMPTGTLAIGANGQVQTHPSPTYSFTVQYREVGASAWQSQPAASVGVNRLNLAPLHPCTHYEVQLLTHCLGQPVAAPSASLFIDTPCQVPQQLTATSLTATTALLGITTRFATYCGTPPRTTAVVEYKADGASTWETCYCPSGSPCRLTGLLPGTHYRARSRFQFDGRYYSTYGSEASFRTPAAQP